MAYGIKYQSICFILLLNSGFLAYESQPSTFKFTVRPSLEDFIAFQPRTTERHCIFQHIIKLLLATRPDIWQCPCAYKDFHVKALWETPERKARPWTCLPIHQFLLALASPWLCQQKTHTFSSLPPPPPLVFHSKVLSTEPTEGSKLSGFRNNPNKQAQAVFVCSGALISPTF